MQTHTQEKSPAEAATSNGAVPLAQLTHSHGNESAAHRQCIDPVQAFQDAIASAGLTPPETIIADGKIQRFSTNGKRSDDSGWYCLHLDNIPAGRFGNWREART
jgi:hypothetical protein